MVKNIPNEFKLNYVGYYISKKAEIDFYWTKPSWLHRVYRYIRYEDIWMDTSKLKNE